MIRRRDIVALALAGAALAGGAACGGSAAPGDGGSATSSTESGASSGLVLGSSGLIATSSSTPATSRSGSSGSSGTASGSGSSGVTSSATSSSSASSTAASSSASSSGTASSASSSANGSSSGASSSSANACGTLPVTCSTYNCPPNSVCAGTNGCSCKGSTLAIQCDGGFCPATGCVAPGWWCAPLEPGPCGALNFDVGCATDAGSYFCPANATCLGGGCTCNLGYSAETCGGGACSSTNVCAYPNWWCAPPDGG